MDLSVIFGERIKDRILLRWRERVLFQKFWKFGDGAWILRSPLWLCV